MSDYKAIGKAFIEFYYNKFDTGPREGVAALYVRRSVVFLFEFIRLAMYNLYFEKQQQQQTTYRNLSMA
jgi:hypothetical protein